MTESKTWLVGQIEQSLNIWKSFRVKYWSFFCI